MHHNLHGDRRQYGFHGRIHTTLALAAFEAGCLKDVVEGEFAPLGYPKFTSRATDDEIDARIRRTISTFYHGDASVTLGKAVDTECRLLGTKGLRVGDASVIPVPISDHYQVANYALTEQMAQIIAGVS